jgi:hypothetical protein
MENDDLTVAFSVERYFKVLSPEAIAEIFICSMQVCTFILNSILIAMRIETLFIDGRFTTCWVANSLNTLIFYELSQRLISGDIIRQCACKTCREYFQIYGNDTRKIYCSVRCAQLEAKRKQRERQKSKEGV